MIYITGDKHGDFHGAFKFCEKNKTSKNDVLIILGDACINYFEDGRDYFLKEKLNNLNITLFCVHGNHEQRPENIKSYKTIKFYGGQAYQEPEYENIIFAKDAEVYDFNNKKCLVLGGAYSIDKEIRLLRYDPWFKDENIKSQAVIKAFNISEIDCILTHTCPLKYEPKEVFLSGYDQDLIDKTSELFLDLIDDRINYEQWYCGHWHTDRWFNKIRFMYHDIIQL